MTRQWAIDYLSLIPGFDAVVYLLLELNDDSIVKLANLAKQLEDYDGFFEHQELISLEYPELKLIVEIDGDNSVSFIKTQYVKSSFNSFDEAIEGLDEVLP